MNFKYFTHALNLLTFLLIGVGHYSGIFQQFNSLELILFLIFMGLSAQVLFWVGGEVSLGKMEDQWLIFRSKGISFLLLAFPMNVWMCSQANYNLFVVGCILSGNSVATQKYYGRIENALNIEKSRMREL